MNRILEAPLALLLWIIVGFGWLVARWPRRVPDLARFTGGRRFTRLHAAWAGWLDDNFRVIEDGAPWLDRAGAWVFDRCHTSAPGTRGRPLEFVALPRPPVEVRCERDVTVVYGFDGRLSARLSVLGEALAAAGWREGGTVVSLPELSARSGRGELPLDVHLDWSPLPGIGLAPGQSPTGESYTVGDGWVEMGIGWISREESAAELRTFRFGQPGDRGRTANLEEARQLGWPADLTAANIIYQPVEVSPAGLDELAARAVARHEYAIAIRITGHYYPNAEARDERLPRRLRPIRPTGRRR
jgi:hypothetical protein